MKYLVKLVMLKGNVVEIVVDSTSKEQVKKDVHLKMGEQVESIISVCELEKALVE